MTAITTRTSSDDAHPFISLAEASHHVTGTPSASAVWRWCRRGVLARDGSRIRLEHRRVGGKIYTSAPWLDAFTKTLTDADTAYFAAKQDAATGAAPRAPGFGGPKRPRNRRRTKSTIDPSQQRRVADELDGEGM
jgi:hypothetical protein